ncbi:MAG: outer membrane receptor protein involved in Fe transport [Cyclobacteriaceae bacterium]|jgi:outer membrane receptor protein involved in Fe transport
MAQTTVSGKILDGSNGEALIGVNVLVKGTVLGTITNVEGEFKLNIKSAPPVSLVISSVGFERQEIQITEANTSGLEIILTESTMLGQEVVVSASRVEESILESPVSIEKMDILDIVNTSADTYYKAIANLKGVDVTSSSINFQIINARGFGSTGNTRFVQLIDGMDTQAPALNFPIGNLNGPSELDVESVELIPGASSALYGPNAFNGVLLINSKNAFDYQGLSAFFKQGVNHVGPNADRATSPMYEGSIRYAKAFNDKFAFKVNASYSKAQDWQGTDAFDRNAAFNPLAGVGGVNPGADRLHFHGDEAAASLALLGQAAALGLNSGLQATFRANNTGNGFSMLDYATDLPNHVVSLTPFEEESLINYGAENMKASAGLYYRLNDKVEASYLYNAGFGTSIYTGAQRYSLSNFGIQQHRVQLRGDNFFVRAYGTFENSGDSYITEFLALKMNEEFANQGGLNFQSIPRSQRYVEFLPPPGKSVNNILTSYALAYVQFLANGNGELGGLAPGEIGGLDAATRAQYELAAHTTARSFIDDIYNFAPGTPEFDAAKAAAINGTVPNGPKFADKSGMYHAEGQYDFKNEIDWMDLQVGASFRTYNLNSQGTIFADTAGAIQISEFGAYAQAAKRLNDFVKLSGSLRYDKNQNFDGQVNPRLSSVFSVAKDHNIRVSYQTGFRVPTTQGQYIDLDVISSRLLGGLPEFYEKYLPNPGENFYYDQGSVLAYRNNFFSTGTFDTSILEQYGDGDFESVKPERVKSFEVGYKSLINNKLLIDAVYYHSTYTDFITQIGVVVGADNGTGSVNPASLVSSSSSNTYSIYTNLNQQVTTQGAAIGLDYEIGKGYSVSGNYNWNQFIGGYDEGTINDFNTPEHKFNVQFGNRKLTDRLGFNFTYRWQDAFRWESAFARGDVPGYATLDGQISYKIPNMKSILRVGGSNLTNQSYLMTLGAPNIGAIYYISITFDELMN